MDADDWLEPDYLERLYGPTLRHRLDVVTCGFIRDAFNGKEPVAQKGQENGKEQYIPMEDTDTEIKTLLCRYKSLGPGVWAKIVRKGLLLEQEIFFPEGLAYEDHLGSIAASLCVSCIYPGGPSVPLLLEPSFDGACPRAGASSGPAYCTGDQMAGLWSAWPLACIS